MNASFFSALRAFQRRHCLSFPVGLTVIASLLSSSVAHGTTQVWDGGTNQWDLTTQDWGTPGAVWLESYNPSTSTITNTGDIASFTTAGGTVTISDTNGDVAANNLDFKNNGLGAYTFTGDTLYTTDAVTSGAGAAGSTNLIIDEAGSSAVTFNNAIDHVGATTQVISNASSNNLTFNGNLSFLNNNAATTIWATDTGTGEIVFNSTVTTIAGSNLQLSGAGTVEFGTSSNFATFGAATGSNSFSLVLNKGNALLDADTFLSTSGFKILGSVGDTQHGFLTNGAFIGTQNIEDNFSTGLLGGNAAVASGWSGSVNLDNSPSNFTFSQVAGGRFNYTGLIKSGTSYIITSGGGTVLIGGAGNTYLSGTMAGDLQAKNTLITNTAGSAFGGTSTAVVNVEAGKTLGGTGISTQKVVAIDATSIIAAGDSGSDNGVASIGTLHLNGGLTSAANGLTMDFKLTSPGVNDSISLAGGALTLTGTVTVNLTAFGTASAGTYTLATGTAGTGVWSDTGAVFDFTAPVGESVTSYNFNTTTDQFTVTLGAAPEPNTWGLMITGIGLLALGLRFKKICRS